MNYKRKLFAFGMCALLALQFEDARSCTKEEIYANGPYGCSCDWLDSCVAGAGVISWFGSWTYPISYTQRDNVMCMKAGGGMHHCPNWDHGKDGNCGLQHCNQETLDARRHYLEHKDFYDEGKL